MNDALEESERLLGEGDLLTGDEALAKYQAAWAVLPEPKDEQEPAIRILGAIADCEFYRSRWDECRAAIQHVFRCGADLANSLLRLRLGQALYELGDQQEAANWLVPAYLSEGRALFAEDDPKYLVFLHSKLQPPPGGWPQGW
jgi:hypothetical protein